VSIKIKLSKIICVYLKLYLKYLKLYTSISVGSEGEEKRRQWIYEVTNEGIS